jgi:hypothetical protein
MWENLYVVVTQFAIEKQLEDLPHMLLFLNPMSQKFIIIIIYILTLKYTSHFGMRSKKLNLKGKTQNFKNKYTRILFFNLPSLVFSYLFGYLHK